MQHAGLVSLASGAEGRWTNEPRSQVVVLVDGGRAGDVPGTWSASLEWLVARLAPRFPELAFLEVRYRIKSWHRLEMCVDDATSALEFAAADGGRSCALVGFSMGGAVATVAARHPSVTTVVGLAPWLPERLDLTGLRGRRFAVIHGTLDGRVPGIVGVDPRGSLDGYRRACGAGAIGGGYTSITGGVHGVALRGPRGLVRLPRAGRWLALLARELELFNRTPTLSA